MTDEERAEHVLSCLSSNYNIDPTSGSFTRRESDVKQLTAAFAAVREECAKEKAGLNKALKAISEISQSDLREAMRHGDEMHILGAMTGLFNRCRDIADQAIRTGP